MKRGSSHAAPVQFIGQRLEVVCRTEACVELSRVGNPITVVGIPVSTTRTLIVLADGTDPNYGKVIAKVTQEISSTHWL